MAKKTKKRTSPKRKTAPKRKSAVKRKAAPARKAAPKAKTKAKAKPVAKEAERRRLLSEERALERDVENEEESSTLPQSAEYIPGALDDDLAEELGEAVVETATTGAQADEDIRDEEVPEEVGGPFVPSTARKEFALGTDESNPEDAEPADFPTANRRPR
jgi:hypothetical protein